MIRTHNSSVLTEPADQRFRPDHFSIEHVALWLKVKCKLPLPQAGLHFPDQAALFGGAFHGRVIPGDQVRIVLADGIQRRFGPVTNIQNGGVGVRDPVDAAFDRVSDFQVPAAQFPQGGFLNGGEQFRAVRTEIIKAVRAEIPGNASVVFGEGVQLAGNKLQVPVPGIPPKGLIIKREVVNIRAEHTHPRVPVRGQIRGGVFEKAAAGVQSRQFIVFPPPAGGVEK